MRTKSRKRHKINGQVSGKIHLSAKVLDYGCGAGRSTRYFKKIIGIKDVLSVDPNREMLKRAKAHDHNGKYILIDTARVPAEDNQFDIVILSFVLVEIGTAEEIKKILTELKRVLKKGSILFIVTVAAELFQEQYDWVSYDQKNRGNYNLQNCTSFPDS